MGLMDKFKNLFTDEEFEDEEDELDEPVKIKEVKKEESKKDKLPTFMREKIEKEEQNKKSKDDDVKISDFEIDKDMISHIDLRDTKFEKPDVNVESNNIKDNSFKFPIDFDDDNFSDKSRVSRQSRKSKSELTNDSLQSKSLVSKSKLHKEEKKDVKVAELYKDKREDVKEDVKRFQATPIISPIYGVLDKNYRKEEIRPVNGDNYELSRPSKNIDFDSVRKKAFGSNSDSSDVADNTLVDDIKNNMMCENCDYFRKAKSCKKNLDEDNLMYDALCERNDSDDITLDEATENYFDYGVEYEKTPDVDSYQVDDDVDDEVKIVNHDEEINRPKKTKKNTVPPVKSSINLLSTLKKSMGDEEQEGEEPKKNLELTDDLFNLIDSMYDEGNE